MNRRGFFKRVAGAVLGAMAAPSLLVDEPIFGPSSLVAAYDLASIHYVVLQPKWIHKTYMLESAPMPIRREPFLINFGEGFTRCTPNACPIP